MYGTHASCELLHALAQEHVRLHLCIFVFTAAALLVGGMICLRVAMDCGTHASRKLLHALLQVHALVHMHALVQVHVRLRCCWSVD